MKAQSREPAPVNPDGSISLPAIGYETYQWESNIEIPHRHRLEYHGPYSAALLPAIADVRFTIPSALAEQIDDASNEIARFDTEMGGDVAPFAAILLRTESVASSKIENLTASAKAIALAELGDVSKQNAAIIVANVNAMRAALELADRIDEQSILDMHTALLGSTRPEWCGHWRDVQVWIGGGNYGPHGASFVPPHHDNVPTAMSDLVTFMRRTDISPLAHAAIAHGQFETIHPFPDGNGRTGRAIVHSLLRHRQLTRSVTIPVSAGLLTDTAGYFAALETFREGDAGPIVLRFAEASHWAVANGRVLARELRTIRSSWDDLIRARSDSVAYRLADLLLGQPAVDSALVERELGVSRVTALSSIDRLASIGVLKEIPGGKWGRKWTAAAVLQALDGYALRSGRRTT
jgi:Fic family protein